jgi:hypothetical protein
MEAGLIPFVRSFPRRREHTHPGADVGQFVRVPDHVDRGDASGARRFITNNERDFSGSIKEIDITCPADLG